MTKDLPKQKTWEIIIMLAAILFIVSSSVILIVFVKQFLNGSLTDITIHRTFIASVVPFLCILTILVTKAYVNKNNL